MDTLPESPPIGCKSNNDYPPLEGDIFLANLGVSLLVVCVDEVSKGEANVNEALAKACNDVCKEEVLEPNLAKRRL
jgi:hypothetical protein